MLHKGAVYGREAFGRKDLKKRLFSLLGRLRPDQPEAVGYPVHVRVNGQRLFAEPEDPVARRGDSI